MPGRLGRLSLYIMSFFITAYNYFKKNPAKLVDVLLAVVLALAFFNWHDSRRDKSTASVPEIKGEQAVAAATGSAFALQASADKIDLSLLPLQKVIDAVDGDTIILKNNERVRYIGLDTPETVHPKKQIECFGREASKFNKKLVEDKKVHLEKDISDRDQYGRLLRYVYVEDEKGKEIFVNLELVKQGYARVITYPPDVKYQAEFLKAQKEAQYLKKGLWDKCMQLLVN